MHLGALISRLENEDDAGEALAAIGDLVLFAEVAAMGERYCESPATYTAAAVARFASSATPDDWVSLMGALERSDDPSRTFLKSALKWCLSHDAVEPETGRGCHSAWRATPQLVMERETGDGGKS